MFYAGIMEEVFFLYHDSHPQGHLSICPKVRICLPKSPYGLVLVPMAKDLVQLMKIFNYMPHLSHLYQLALISSIPPPLP